MSPGLLAVGEVIPTTQHQSRNQKGKTLLGSQLGATALESQSGGRIGKPWRGFHACCIFRAAGVSAFRAPLAFRLAQQRALFGSFGITTCTRNVIIHSASMAGVSWVGVQNFCIYEERDKTDTNLPPTHAHNHTATNWQRAVNKTFPCVQQQ